MPNISILLNIYPKTILSKSIKPRYDVIAIQAKNTKNTNMSEMWDLYKRHIIKYTDIR